MTITKHEGVLHGAEGKRFSWDLCLPEPEAHPNPPLVLFLHGFKGFKDWGHFPLLAEAFAENGLAFLKMNFSHNGVSPEQPTEFVDLEAFRYNTFSKELTDVQALLDALFANQLNLPGALAGGLERRVGILGFSRGGGIAILQGERDARLGAVATWSSIARFQDRFSQDLYKRWEREGVLYILNSRTQQNLPMDYTLVQDMQENASDLDILEACSRLGGKAKPQLILHGAEDETVTRAEFDQLRQANPQAVNHLLAGAGHTLGGAHPWEQQELPLPSKEAVQLTGDFFLRILTGE